MTTQDRQLFLGQYGFDIITGDGLEHTGAWIGFIVVGSITADLITITNNDVQSDPICDLEVTMNGIYVGGKITSITLDASATDGFIIAYKHASEVF